MAAGDARLAMPDDFLARLDEKLRQRNERLMRRLHAWADLLDAAGWCVALDSPGGGLWISGNAERDLRRSGEMPSTWVDLLGRIPAKSIHHGGQGLLIWPGPAVGHTTPELAASLTRRESEVMSWLQQGKTAPEIAIILGCASRTVEKHLANLYQKLGIKNRAAVILNPSKPVS
jgi:DNA-binding CsgD family transcriptional regulator